MLEIGNADEKFTLDEYKTHFALWAIAKSPLILGMDLTKVKSEVLEIVTNKRLIKLNQDSFGQQGRCV